MKRNTRDRYVESVNTLGMFDKGESYKHFMAKATLFWALRRLGHEVKTEAEVFGRNTSQPMYAFDMFKPLGVADILDLTTQVQYEVEASHMPSKWRKKAEQYARNGWEVIIVPIHKMPEDMAGILDFVQQYVRPD